jgi:NAD(P)-dependent dehydrogenase (short-subunit alcohol dehydrogenase family)
MPANLFDLTGRVALVTGGNKGLGKAMARGFAEAGADVVIASRHEDELKSALDHILAGTGRRGAYCVTDVSVRDDVKKLAQFALDKMGKVDILVNNAGMNAPQAIDAITDDTWDRVLEVNLSSVMALTRELTPQMKARKWGRIVHISSVMGQVSKEKRNVYSATKAALIGLVRANAIDLGPFGITANCIAPGTIGTGRIISTVMPGRVDGNRDPTERIALRRIGTVEDCAKVVEFLVTDLSDYVSGTVIPIDGGLLR